MSRGTASGCLLAGTSQAIAKHRCPTVGAAVAPEFMSKHNSEPIVSGGWSADDAARPEVGEENRHASGCELWFGLCRELNALTLLASHRTSGTGRALPDSCR